MTTNVTLNLGQGRTYTIPDNPEVLAALGPAILSHLGCSYEIRWPDKTDADKQRRQEGRVTAQQRRREDAEVWAGQHLMGRDAADRDYVRGLLVEAYIAGYDAAPKGVNR
jgi:hypothetical protein